jgi:hypothetical protein
MPSKIIAIIRYVIAFIGIFIAFYYYFLPNVIISIQYINIFCVGLVGLISFFSHFIFYRSDAARLGWDKGNPNFQFEVGFANLSFSLVAFSSYFGNWGIDVEAAIILCYSLYLLQASILHIYLFFNNRDNGKKRSAANVIFSFLFPAIMLFFPLNFFIK